MAHVLNSISFYNLWTSIVPDCMKPDTEASVSICMADVWTDLYRNSEAYKACADPISCNINVKPYDIVSAASNVMSEKNLFQLCGMEQCIPKHSQELARRFTVIIFRICIMVEQHLELEDLAKGSESIEEDITYDF